MKEVKAGERFGRIVVLGHEGTVKQGRQLVPTLKCLCDCGNITYVTKHELENGHTKSCGCLRRERASRLSYIHGDSHGRLYEEWTSMKKRCNYRKGKSYHLYGGRGIKVCDEWYDYLTFKRWALENGYSDGLTLDRINVDGNYEPSNCRWATVEVQSNNRRNNHYLTCDGTTRTISQWARIIGISRGTLQGRLRRGWPIEEALQMPIMSKGWSREKNGGKNAGM